MKNIYFIILFFLISTLLISQNSWIRVNQVGYLENDVKVAVFFSKSDSVLNSFDLVDYNTNIVVFEGFKVYNVGETWGFDSSARLDFSEFKTPGKYYIRINDLKSVPFRIGDDIYSDASDYLQYVATSANAVYQMLFAYSKYPNSFGDFYDANGDDGPNGIPDILDEAKWGLDWLIRMNPDSNTYFNQLADYYPEFAKMLEQKALDAYRIGAANPGVSQTAPGGAPYFYEEDNWVDDMELAATELFIATGDNQYLSDAINYGRKEPVTPWMGADSARHYQWYPFINMGHYQIASQKTDLRASSEFIRNMKSGIQRVVDRANENAFLYGIPFIWCSNNLFCIYSS